MAKKFKHYYRQLDAMDCGPTCIKMIAKYYGAYADINLLKHSSKYSRDGVSLLGMSEAAEDLGFKTLGAKITFDSLINEVTLPAVIHWNRYHFVVVLPDSTSRKIIVADPAIGRIEYTKNEFLTNWFCDKNEKGENVGIVLLVEPTPKLYENREETRRSLGWVSIFSYVTKYRQQFFQLLIGLFLGSMLQLIFPFLTRAIVDTGINTKNISFIQLILVAQFVLLFSRTLVEFLRNRILLFISVNVNLNILSEFWIKLMRLPMEFFDTKRTGDIIQRINDHTRIESFITGAFLNTFFSIFQLITFSVILLFFDNLIFTIFFCSTFLYILWITFFLKYRSKIDYKRFAVSSDETSATMQLIFGMQEIKLNNAEHLKRWRWEGIQSSLFKLKSQSLNLTQIQQTGAFFINEGKNIAITFISATLVINDEITLGTMLAIQYIIGQLNGPVEQLVSFSQQAQDARLSLERLNEIHNQKDEGSRGPEIYSIPPNSEIIFDNVSFAYAGAGNSIVLKNLSFNIPFGKTTAIVGGSGSGKTTILKLLQKFYESYEGDIKVADSELKYINSHTWRAITGSVMQEGFIFSDSIARNIAVGDENVDLAKLAEACKSANILSFIQSLPLGFNTNIGAEGNGISAGQRQRILIARAIYKNPDFIFLDEATNALDATNEVNILDNIRTYFKGKTIVVVAHRLSTIKNADNILVLDNGRIIEQGKHSELTIQKGKYYELVKNQMELQN